MQGLCCLGEKRRSGSRLRHAEAERPAAWLPLTRPEEYIDAAPRAPSIGFPFKIVPTARLHANGLP